MLLIIESEPVMLQEVFVVLVYCDRKLQSKTFYFCLGCLSLYQIIKICTRLWEDALKIWAAKTAMRGRPVDDKPQKQAVEPQKKQQKTMSVWHDSEIDDLTLMIGWPEGKHLTWQRW